MNKLGCFASQSSYLPFRSDGDAKIRVFGQLTKLQVATYVWIVVCARMCLCVYLYLLPF